MGGAPVGIQPRPPEAATSQCQRQQGQRQSQDSSAEGNRSAIGITQPQSPSPHADGLAAPAPGHKKVPDRYGKQRHTLPPRRVAHIHMPAGQQQAQGTHDHPQSQHNPQIIEHGGKAPPQPGLLFHDYSEHPAEQGNQRDILPRISTTVSRLVNRPRPAALPNPKRHASILA